MTAPQSRIISLDDLPTFAREFSRALKSGDRICLTGEMGAGKTTFLFHVARVLGVSSDAGFASPTFTILNRYEARDLTINHVDLYRISSYREFENLDLMPFLEEVNSVTFIEWGEKFLELKDFFTKTLHFELIHGEPEARRITRALTV